MGESLPPGLSPQAVFGTPPSAGSIAARNARSSHESLHKCRKGQTGKAKKSDSFHGRKACLSVYIFAHRPFDKLREHLRQVQGTAVTLNLFQGLFRNKIPVFQTSHIRHLFRFVVSSATPSAGDTPATPPKTKEHLLA